MTRWITRLQAALRSLVTRRRADRDLDDEMAFHLDQEISERVRAGAAPAEARRAGRLSMGAVERSKEECRDERTGGRLSRLCGEARQDLRFGLRLFRKHPLPTTIAIGGLGLAIGVATAAFSIVNASILRPYGMDDPATVISVGRVGHHRLIGFPYAQFVRMRESATTVRLEAATARRMRVATTRDEEAPARLVAFVSGGYFDTLGGQTTIGRPIGPIDDIPSAAPVVALSEHVWRTVFGADPAVLGRAIWVNDAPATVVGVVRAGFSAPIQVDARPAVWAPLGAYDDLQAGPAFGPTAGTSVEVVGRLAPGVDASAVADNLNTVLNAAFPLAADEARTGDAGAALRADVAPAHSPMDSPSEGDVVAGLSFVSSALVLVLALACANVANLLLASAVTRRREVGVRLAIGATRRRLVKQMVTESLLLGLIAGAAGLLIAFWLVPIFGALVEMPPDLDLAPDGRVFLFALAIAIVSGVGAGLSPARFGARGELARALADGGTRGSAAAIPARFRSTFVGFQAAVSVLLLVVAALLTRAALRAASTDPGFDVNRVVGVMFNHPSEDFDGTAFLARATDVVRGVNGVESVSVAETLPFGPFRDNDQFKVGERVWRAFVYRGDAEYFTTTGVRVVRGRGFTAEEAVNDAPVAIVSESVARGLLGERDPIGQSIASPNRFVRDGPLVTAIVVGVAAEALMTPGDDERSGAVYRPLTRQPARMHSLVIRTTTPGTTARAVETALRPIDVRVQARTLIVRDRLAEFHDQLRRIAWLVGPVAALALLLAVLGVYGVTAFVVSRRTEEMSVRMALGAAAGDVVRLLVRDSLRPVAVGLVCGAIAALVLAQLVADELSGVSPRDPAAVGTAIAILIVAAVAAVLLPARRAARANPAELLRRG
jgi:predicted permease